MFIATTFIIPAIVLALLVVGIFKRSRQLLEIKEFEKECSSLHFRAKNIMKVVNNDIEIIKNEKRRVLAAWSMVDLYHDSVKIGDEETIKKCGTWFKNSKKENLFDEE